MVCILVQGYAFRVCHLCRIREGGRLRLRVCRIGSIGGCLGVVRLGCLGILLSSSGRVIWVCLSSGYRFGLFNFRVGLVSLTAKRSMLQHLGEPQYLSR